MWLTIGVDTQVRVPNRVCDCSPGRRGSLDAHPNRIRRSVRIFSFALSVSSPRYPPSITIHPPISPQAELFCFFCWTRARQCVPIRRSLRLGLRLKNTASPRTSERTNTTPRHPFQLLSLADARISAGSRRRCAGTGSTLAEAAAALEEIHASGCNGAAAHAQMYIMGSILRHGSEEQKEVGRAGCPCGRV